MSNVESVTQVADSADREAEMQAIMVEATRIARNAPDTQPDGGWGCGKLGRSTVGEVVELITNPYAGTEEPKSVIIRPPMDEFMLSKPA